MTTALALILTLSVLTGVLYLVNKVIDADGHGHRPPPRSHHDEEARQRQLAWH